MKKYIKIDNSNKAIKVQVKYNIGGINYATYKNEHRGYYLHVQPVEIEQRENGITIESYTAFTGYKMNLNIIKRDSKKAYEEALKLAEIELPNILKKVIEELN